MMNFDVRDGMEEGHMDLNNGSICVRPSRVDTSLFRHAENDR